MDTIDRKPQRRTLRRLLFLGVASVVLFISCTKDAPVQPPARQSIFLEESYATAKEIGVRITITNKDANTSFILKRNGIEVQTGRIFGNDSVLTDKKLLSGTNYVYQALKKVENKTVDSTPVLNIRTLDTTDHNYTWTSYNIGRGGSRINDVTVINDSDIWVVGDIYGNQPEDYCNSAHWNGREWQLNRIEYAYKSIEELTTVCAISSDDIWAGSSILYHYNGNIWKGITDGWKIKSSVYKIWGSSPNDVFFVGGQGGIVHWNGKNFITMESGTLLPLYDVYGSSPTDIYACGFRSPSTEGILMHSDGKNWETVIRCNQNIDQSTLFTTYLLGQFNAVWIDENGDLLTLCQYLYKYHKGKWNFVEDLPENSWKATWTTRDWLIAIRGTASNNYFLAGSCGSLLHWNGSTFKQVGIPYSQTSEIFFFNMDMKGNTVCAVGIDQSNSKRGFILVGTKL
jgi:hypothetical protein